MLSLLLVPACKTSDSVADVLLVAAVEVTPPSASIGPQETLQLSATPKTSGGLELPARTVAWSSSAPGVVSVSSDGLARGVAVGGPVTVHATIDGVGGDAVITVTAVPVARVTVTPAQVNLQAGGTLQLTATAYDASNGVLAGRAFFWQSNAPGIAPVTTDGLVIGQSDGGPVSITATTGGKVGTATVSVAPRPATRLGFTQQPTATASGNVIVPAVRVAIQDDLLHTVTGATNAVSIAVANNPSGATLGGTRTVSAVGGIATFNDLTLDKGGSGFTLVASAAGLSSAVSAGFDVVGVAAKLAIATQPATSAQSGVVLTRQPVVLVTDAGNNPVAGAAVTASIASGSATLGGTLTASSGANGQASFTNLVIRGTVGTYQIRFSSPGTSSVTSGNISLSAGSASQLTLTTQPPAATTVGTTLSPRPEVQLRDAEGNKVSRSGVAITVAIASGPSGGSLSGTTTVNTNSSGVASFGNLKLSKAGTYTLKFTSPGLTQVISAAILVL